ncbi:MAG: hypothetical protein ACKO5P_07625 [Nodosilinea sp.]
MDALKSSPSQYSQSSSSTATLPPRSDNSNRSSDRHLPYTPDQQVELLHLQAEIDVLLLRLQALSIKAD